MDEDKRADEKTTEQINDARQSPPSPEGEQVDPHREPAGPNNIREGNVRGTMFGGPTKSRASCLSAP